jgi:hypothetical protein
MHIFTGDTKIRMDQPKNIKKRWKLI